MISMIAEYGVVFSTGTDLSDNERYRIAELIHEELAKLGALFQADISVRAGHFLPGPPRPTAQELALEAIW